MSEELVLRFGPREPDGSYPIFVLGSRGAEETRGQELALSRAKGDKEKGRGHPVTPSPGLPLSPAPLPPCSSAQDAEEVRAGTFHPPFSGDLTAEVAETEVRVLEYWAGAAPGERMALLGILEKLAKRLTAMGAALSEALFTANPPLAQALAEAPADTPLVLQFEPEEGELLRLPWEYLTDGSTVLTTGSAGRRLATLRPLARRLALTPGPSPNFGRGELPLTPSPLPPCPSAQVRLLACIAEPLDQGPLDGAAVREGILAATRPLREAG